MIIQKGTELGISEFVPFLSARSVIRLPLEKDKANKAERYSKIIKGASEQCRRGKVPELKKIYEFKDLLKIPAKTKLIAYESVAVGGKPFLDEVSEDTLLVIGPEGGFSPEEADLLISNGFTPISLGRRILRTETACIAAAANYALKYEKQ